MKNIRLSGIAFLILFVMKLAGYIDMSWVWVTAPLWISAGISFFFAFLFFLINAVIE